MRLLTSTSSLATVASTLLFSSTILSVSAHPYQPLITESPSIPEFFKALDARDDSCATHCGWNGVYCCAAGQACVTDSNNIASCVAGGGAALAPGAGGAQAPQPTVTVTVFAGGSGSGATGAQCNLQLGQQQCGNTCCAQGQFCNGDVCIANGATTAAATIIVSGGGGPSTITAAVRPTSISTYTVFTSAGMTTTIPFMAPATATANITASSTGSHLSGGAIAGIVIGVLAGIIILILLIICCCARGLLDLIRPKRKTEVTEVYEGHHHHGGAAAGGGRRFPFFGGGGGGSDKRKDSKKGWLGVAGILGAIALILGLKRRHDRREEEKESTAYTYSDYTYSYSGTSDSSASSDRRSRPSRMTRSDIRGSRR